MAVEMRLDNVLELLEKLPDDEGGERSTADENVTAINTTKEVDALISPLDSELINDEDLGDKENTQLHYLPRNQMIAVMSLEQRFAPVLPLRQDERN